MTKNLFKEDVVRKNIKEAFENVKEAALNAGRNPEEISLMAVTKTVAPELINIALEEGVSYLGENRVQEFNEKLPFYNASKEKIHFIGHLQTNKIRGIIEKISMVESVDSLHLAKELSRECAKIGIDMEILLQINIGKEETKGGFSAEEIFENLKFISELSNLKVRGLMAIPPMLSSEKYFPEMQELFLSCKEQLKEENFSVLSMGMSNDYEKAIAYGSTQVRLGRALFGERLYI